MGGRPEQNGTSAGVRLLLTGLIIVVVITAGRFEKLGR
jgi:hypothetical protein